MLVIVGRLELCRGDVPERLEEATIVEPMNPLERGEFDSFAALPRSAPIDHFGLEERVNGLSEGVVVRVSFAANGRFDARLCKALGVANRKVLYAAVAVVDETFARSPCPEGLLKGIESQIATKRRGHAPAHDESREDVDDEGYVDES